jgi:UDP-N-acetylmuramate--alanine ligase
MNVKKNIYFIGIGGIGMSALARFFHAKGHQVAGYDKSDSPLIRELVAEGIEVILEDRIELLPAYLNPSDTLVVRTPAVPADAVILGHVKEAGYELIKRSELLAMVSQGMRSIAVAGTHGKTTTSSMIAHILTHSGFGCNAFIGGVMTGYNTNVLINPESKFMVLEADEFDRSFHHLQPELAVITSLDPDHLDIYETEDNFRLAFQTFAAGVQSDGTLFSHDAIPPFPISTSQQSYGLDDAMFKASNIHIKEGAFHFDLIHSAGKINDLVLHMPGRHNVTNATAACAIALALEIPEVKIREALDAYEGVHRRFQFHQRGPVVQLIDDYAHHPSEIKACLNAARELFPDKKLTVAFQPHLFSRTRDFLDGFAESLSLADEVVLVPIYPAREKPIPGVTSEEILNRMSLTNTMLCTKEELPTHFAARELEVLLILGAGDIDRTIPLINSVLSKRNLGQ